jgi:hypothetical protein
MSRILRGLFSIGLGGNNTVLVPRRKRVAQVGGNFGLDIFPRLGLK